MSEQESTEVVVYEDEAKRLSEGKPRIITMHKDGDKFYFDTTDLPEHSSEYVKLRQDGWQVAGEGEELPAYLPSRQQAIEDAGLIPNGWGYHKAG